jgi:hypothetical protein
MVKRPTIILLVVLALVVGAYFVIKNHPFNASGASPTATGSSYLITSADGVLQSLRIDDNQGHTVMMQRDPSKVWVVVKPTPGEADQSLAGAAETQVGALLIVTTLETMPDLSTMGLDSPADTIQLTFDSGIQHKLEVGGLTPTGSGYYVRFDGGQIYVISQSGIDSLLNLLTAPPYPATATPVFTETPAETPTQGAETPTVTVVPATATP